jgi:hypothetical protein
MKVVRSKTAQGFIANFASAGQKSLDRTEPMIGAKVSVSNQDVVCVRVRIDARTYDNAHTVDASDNALKGK